MPRFRKKPVVIEAIRLTGKVVIETREGKIIGYPGDWLLTGVQGEKYPCGHEIFLETYEPADKEAAIYLLKMLEEDRRRKRNGDK